MSERVAALTGLESLETQQDALYHRFLSERNEAVRASLVKQMYAVTNRILEHKDAADAIRLGARLILLYVEGTDANLVATHEAGLARHMLSCSGSSQARFWAVIASRAID